ncbi:MAG: AAA family ATPase [candidate division WOR-3 bacterium]|nr:AAA family ATPase [Candidatus Omnitrophota bacterium]MCM8807070.1 AAA family ATPase [Candidatus Omnitrophota bacterium]
MEMKIIAFSNQKGGTGKTTICVNLAAGLVKLNERVLIIDLDPQGNSTVSVGINLKPDDLTVREFILGEARIEDVMVDSYMADLSIIPSNPDLAHVEIEIANKSKNQFYLKRAIENSKEVLKSFDYIFIDCPPSLSILTINGLCASNYVLIPVLVDYLSLQGLSNLLETIEQVKKKLNPGLEILGIIPNMLDYRLKITEESLELLKENFNEKVFKNGIKICSRLRESPSFGKAIFDYARNSQAAVDFLNLAKEFKRRLK